jgi:hypothetical protein
MRRQVSAGNARIVDPCEQRNGQESHIAERDNSAPCGCVDARAILDCAAASDIYSSGVGDFDPVLRMLAMQPSRGRLPCQPLRLLTGDRNGDTGARTYLVVTSQLRRSFMILPSGRHSPIRANLKIL